MSEPQNTNQSSNRTKMKAQTGHPSNMCFIEIRFDQNQVRNVPFEKYEKNFILIVNDQSYKMSRIVADLLSPEISKLHFVDNTINKFSISTSTFEKVKDNENKNEIIKRKNNKEKTERKMVKEIIDTIVKGNVLRIETEIYQEQEQNDVTMKEEYEKNQRKRIFVYEIMRELGREDYLELLPVFQTKITKDNVFDRIKTKTLYNMNAKRKENENEDETKNEGYDQNYNIIKKQIMKEEIEFVSKNFYEIIKEGTKTRENLKKLEVEILEMIVWNENLRLENEESLLKFINELYEKDHQFSKLYEYVEFWNILETNTKIEIYNNDSNCNDWSSCIKNNSSFNQNLNNNDKFVKKDQNKAKEEMRKFIEIFNINDLNIGIWNQLFSNFLSKNQASDNFSSHSANRRVVEKVEGNEMRVEYRTNIQNNILLKNILINLPKTEIIEIEEKRELNGIMRYLTSQTHGNIHDNGTIRITTNSILNNDNNNYHPKYLVDFDEKKYYYSKNEANIFICFDFKDKNIEVSKYQIKSYSHGVNGYNLKNWRLEISNDGTNWEEIDLKKDCAKLNGKRTIGTFVIEKERRFGRFVRLVQTGKNWSDNDYILLYNIEFYGKIIETKK